MASPQPSLGTADPPLGEADAKDITCIALIGNPNTGKTTLFNRLCGVRAKTANFPGSTVDARIGRLAANGRQYEIIDLPGVYAINLDLPEAKLCRDCLDGRIAGREKPKDRYR